MMDTKYIASLDNLVSAPKRLQDQIANRAKVAARQPQESGTSSDDTRTLGASATQLMFVAVPCVLDTAGDVRVIMALGIKPDRIVNLSSDKARPVSEHSQSAFK